MKHRRIFALLAALLLLGALAGCKKDEGSPISPLSDIPLTMESVQKQIDSMKVEDFEETDETTDFVKISVKDHGDIVVRLRLDAAPITVQNFQTLVGQGFYDGLTFHRVYPGFMIQGGDPEGTGSGGSGTNIKGEFASNGVQNPLKHVRGVISMARATKPDTASSQFFIMHADNGDLDGNYAAFGYVVAGLSTVDSVCTVELGYNAWGEPTAPLSPVVITSATFVTPR